MMKGLDVSNWLRFKYNGMFLKWLLILIRKKIDTFYSKSFQAEVFNYNSSNYVGELKRIIKMNIKHEAGINNPNYFFSETIYPLIFAFRKIKFSFAEIRRKNELTKLMNKCHFALDLGTGPGSDLPILKENAKKVIAVDISLPSLKIARYLNKDKKNIHWVVCKAENLPFKNEVFDFIIMKEVLEHIPKYQDALREIKRIGTENCHIFLTTENSSYFKKLFRITFQPFSLLVFGTINKLYSILNKRKPSIITLKCPMIDGKSPDSLATFHYFNQMQLKKEIEQKGFKVICIRGIGSNALPYYWIIYNPKTFMEKYILNFLMILDEVFGKLPLIKDGSVTLSYYIKHSNKQSV